MKLWGLQPGGGHGARRAGSFRSSPPAPNDGGAGAGVAGESPLLFSKPSATPLFWILLHALCCIVSLVLGFRFSRLVFFLLFSPSSYTTPPAAPLLHATTTITTTTTTTTTTQSLSIPILPNHTLATAAATTTTITTTKPADSDAATGSHVVVGRHGILIRPWPHPDPTEVMKAHRILERVQREQRLQHGVKSPRPLIVITPTYVRTFQALHLTALSHSLMLVPYSLTWIVVEAGVATPSNETAAILARSKLPLLHLPFPEKAPLSWADRYRLESRMRLHALRIVRERRMDGIVVFADDSNMHSMELFDEIQSIKWMGAISVGILAHSGIAEQERSEEEKEKENSPLPIQGPACNSSGQLAGWHTFNSLPYAGKSAVNVGDGQTVLPGKMEWAGFVLNSRLVWKDAEGKPEWARDLDTVGQDGEEIESPLALLKDGSAVEPLGNCGKKIMLWWLRVEARVDSRFPPGWIIDPPLEITVPAKRTPWPDAPPELPKERITAEEHVEKRSSSKAGRASRSKQKSRSKRKRETRVDTQVSGETQGQA